MGGRNRLKEIPQSARFIISGGLGTLTNLLIYEIIYLFIPIYQYKASTSWFLAYFIAISTQHAYHRWLTFTDFVPYFQSLRRSYLIYAGSLIISTIFNHILAEQIEIHHRIAFILTMIAVSILNYFALKLYAFAADEYEIENASEENLH